MPTTTPSAPIAKGLRKALIQQEGGVTADPELANDEVKTWNFTKTERAIQNHLSMRNDDFQALVARHREQDDKIEKLTYDLGIAQSSGTLTTCLGAFSGVIAALIPVISIFVPLIKTVISVETLGITGGVIAGALLPMAVWLSSRRRKYKPLAARE